MPFGKVRKSLFIKVKLCLQSMTITSLLFFFSYEQTLSMMSVSPCVKMVSSLTGDAPAKSFVAVIAAGTEQSYRKIKTVKLLC